MYKRYNFQTTAMLAGQINNSQKNMDERSSPVQSHVFLFENGKQH